MFVKLVKHVFISVVLMLSPMLSAHADEDSPVHVWISSEDMSAQLKPLAPSDLAIGDRGRKSRRAATVRILDSETHQSILGLGSSLEHTTCYNIARLPESAQREVVRKLVSTDTGIGMNMMRICMGTPDFTGETWYSYNDSRDGSPDPELRHFTIEKDRAYVLPVLRIALEENPDLLFYASPWSPPGWMTTTGDMIGGKLKREYYASYADYFVRFIQAYAEEGIPVYAVTIQNEPGVDRANASDSKWHYPSCRWTGEDERDFIRDHLGPAFARAGIAAKIWSYDHNFNTNPTPDGDDPGIDYPTTVLRDQNAAKFVDGVAFHGYAGNSDGMLEFARRFPEARMYFTEGSTFGTRGALKVIDYFAHGASSYNAWVTIIDERGGPNNGPFKASRTCVTVNSSSLAVNYHFDYFMYGHFMKFIQRGAVRLGTSSERGARDAVAFRNPNGSVVVIAVNPDASKQSLRVENRTEAVAFTLPAKSVATVVYTG